MRSPWSAATGLSPARACSTTLGPSEERGLGVPEPRGSVDVRGSAAALRPPEGQPGVLRGARLVFLLLFLLSGPISELAFPDEAEARSIGGVARAPIVMVLLDELTSNTLVNADG